MVTVTFDIGAFIAGLIVGICVGTAIVLWAELDKGGAWSQGFSAGFDLKTWLRSKGEYPQNGKKEDA